MNRNDREMVTEAEKMARWAYSEATRLSSRVTALEGIIEKLQNQETRETTRTFTVKPGKPECLFWDGDEWCEVVRYKVDC